MLSPEASKAGSPSPADVTFESEQFRALCDLARKKTAGISPELLAAHVIAVTREADWAVQRAAIDAVLRRIAAMQQDELKIAERPAGGRITGFYATSVGSRRRPYHTLLLSAVPILGACDCGDFQKGSLGLCKHLLTVLADCAHRQSKRKRPLPQDLPPAWPAGRLLWDPIRPLTGGGDWLARVSWTAGQSIPAKLRRWLLPSGGVRPELLGDSKQRLALVRGLSGFVKGAKPAEFDPPIRPLLAAEEKLLELKLEGAGIAGRAPRLLHGLKHRLYPYQRAGVERALSAGRLLLADDMGLGKTAQAIAVSHVLWHAKKVRRGLLIVPASLKSQWLREWSSFSDVPLQIVEGSPDERAAFYDRRKPGFLVANYEQAMRDLQLMQAWKPDLVVLDEAQRIKNWETKTAVAVKALQPKFRLVLTGTPMENRLDELASVMDWVDEFALEPKWRLVPWHTETADGSREAVGAKNLTTLRERLAPSMLRRRRSEVLSQLPSRTDTRVPVELTKEQQDEHDELNVPIQRLVAMSHKRPLKQEEFLRLMSLLAHQRMICNGLALAHYDDLVSSLDRARPTDAVLASLFSPKLRELRELVSNVVVGQEQKVVIFSQWRRMLVLAQWAVADILAKAKMKGVFFSGQESLKRRTANIVALHDDPQTRVLFATDAGGVGLNLQRAATCCINLELPWNPAVLEQRIGRIHRNGQKNPVEVYNLVSNSGIEARIADLVADKRALFGGLFDGTTDEVKFEGSGSFLSRVEKLLQLRSEEAASAASVEDLEPPVDVVQEQREEEDARGEMPEPGEPAETLAPGPATPASEALPVPAAPSPAEPPATETAPALEAASPMEEGRPYPSSHDVQRLLSVVRVQVTSDGGIAITAPREAAASLATLFSEFARKLSEAQDIASQ